jgi:hypothetical protein
MTAIMPAGKCLHVRSAQYRIARTKYLCWSCRSFTRIYGFWIPQGFLWEATDATERGTSPSPAFLCRIVSLSEAVENGAAVVAPSYHFDFDITAAAQCLMNHCENCSARLHDSKLFCSPASPFHSVSNGEVVCFQSANRPIEALAALVSSKDS